MIFDHDRQAKPHTTLIHLLFFVNFWDKFVIYSIILNPATSYRNLKRCQIWTPNCFSHTILTLNCSELPLLLLFLLSICPPFSDCFSHCLSIFNQICEVIRSTWLQCVLYTIQHLDKRTVLQDGEQQKVVLINRFKLREYPRASVQNMARSFEFLGVKTERS